MKIINRFAISIFSLTMMAATGCTERGEPPSLAKRPFETAAAPLPTEAIAPMASDVARATRISSFLEQGRNGKSAFDQNVAVAERALASAQGSVVNSEPWIVAQLALSRLVSLRGAAQTALANLDNERRILVSEPPSEDEQPLNLAQLEIEVLSNRQAETIARLTSMLRQN